MDIDKGVGINYGCGGAGWVEVGTKREKLGQL